MDMTVPGVHDEHPARRSLTIQTSRTPRNKHPITLAKGMRVIVVGRLKQRSYETREGEKRTVFEIEAEEVGPSLKNATVKVTKAARHGGGPAEYEARKGDLPDGPPGADPWATST